MFWEGISASNGDSLKYTHVAGSKMDTFRLYNPSSRKTAFYIEYILKNVIVQHNDINELRLNLLDSTFREDLDVMKIKVNLPSKSSDLRAWAHGPLWGNISIDENKEYVTFTVDDYYSNTKMDIRVTFDKDLVNTTKVSNVDKLDSIIEEETIKADEANKIREEEKLKLENEKKVYRRKMIFSNTVLSIWLVIAIVVIIMYYKKYDKEYLSEFNGKYFRDFPSNHSPEIIEYLITKNISTVSLSASILNIIYKKGFLVEKIQLEKGIFKKKMVDEFRLTVNDNDLKEELTENEKYLRNMLTSILGEKSFVLSDLKMISNTELSAREFIKDYDVDVISYTLDDKIIKSDGFKYE